MKPIAIAIIAAAVLLASVGGIIGWRATASHKKECVRWAGGTAGYWTANSDSALGGDYHVGTARYCAEKR